MHPNVLFTTKITGKPIFTAKSDVNLLLAIGEKKPPHPSMRFKQSSSSILFYSIKSIISFIFISLLSNLAALGGDA